MQDRTGTVALDHLNFRSMSKLEHLASLVRRKETKTSIQTGMKLAGNHSAGSRRRADKVGRCENAIDATGKRWAALGNKAVGACNSAVLTRDQCCACCASETSHIGAKGRRELATHNGRGNVSGSSDRGYDDECEYFAKHVGIDGRTW